MRVHVTRRQAVFSLALAGPLLLSNVVLPFRHSLPNRDKELLFVALVVAVATLGSRAAAVVAALSGAVWYDFFFAGPYQSFELTSAPQIVTVLILVVVSLAITQLASRGRQLQASTTSGTEYLTRIQGAARLAQSSADPEAVLDLVQRHLTELLRLRECRFVAEPDPGRTARLTEDGRITVGHREWDVEKLGMPGAEIELQVVVAGESYRGGFVLVPTPGAPAPFQARLTAVTLADQAAVALQRPPTAHRA
ncbi:DUF4118 domain-containing protein [Streptacidiphilus anmyonensis]|uniref:DUF4118 domain-containing protein n=1 Tax=Streptacidiphilus anmyonensis TaxID=405782 RepID=UPI0005A860DB|nr:DUF4118 domain-containing protein [Streptacidiphilus anmyonensis]